MGREERMEELFSKLYQDKSWTDYFTAELAELSPDLDNFIEYLLKDDLVINITIDSEGSKVRLMGDRCRIQKAEKVLYDAMLASVVDYLKERRVREKNRGS